MRAAQPVAGRAVAAGDPGVAASIPTAADAYERFVGRWSRLWVPALVGLARLAPGARVLEVASGTGQATSALALAVGPSGRVIATDAAVGMVAATRDAVAGPVAFAAMDGQRLAARDESVDGVVCMLGLALLADPGEGLLEFHRVLRPDGRAALGVWAEPDRAPFPGIVAEVLSRSLPLLDLGLATAFSLGDESRIETLLRDTGFEDVSVVRESRPVKFDSFEDLWGPVEAAARAALHAVSAAARRAIREQMRARVAAYATRGQLVMDCEVLLASARR